MKFSTFVFLLPLGLVSASVLGNRDIANNNCGRAVAGTAKGSAFISTARADCSSNVVSTTTVLVTPTASYKLYEYYHCFLHDPIHEHCIIYYQYYRPLERRVYANQLAILYKIFDVHRYCRFNLLCLDHTLYFDQLSSSITVPGSTVTSYIPVTPGPPVTAGPAKREMAERAASASQIIPKYASACTNFAEYALACSAAGVTPGTSTAYSTLSANTVTVVASTTSLATNYATSTTEIDVEFTQISTIVSTTTLSTTITLPATTSVFETDFVTSTAAALTSISFSTVTVTGAAATVTAPVPNFILQMVPVAGGPNLYMSSRVGDGVVSVGTTDITQASIYTIDTSNRLLTNAADPEIACESNSIANYYINNVRPSFLNSHPSYQAIFKPLSCSLNVGLTVTCTYKTANAFTLYNNQWFYSTPNFNNYPTYVAHAIPQ